MKKNKHHKPVLPIYLFGLVWLLYSIFFSLSGFWSLIKCACLALLVFGLASSAGKAKTKKASSKNKKEAPVSYTYATYASERQKERQTEKQPEPPKEKRKEPVSDMVCQGRRYVERIKELNEDIPDYKISAQLKQIEILTASILDQVELQESKQKEVRQFINYYLPTTIKLLEQYVQMQNTGLKGENISVGMSRIEDMLDKVIVAFQKQLDNLFERDIVDITADIQVMEQMMEAQGLTNHSDF